MILELIKKKSDAAAGGIFLAACLVLAAEVMRIKNPQSRVMPFFALGCIALASLWLIFRTLVLRRSPCARLWHTGRELGVWAMFAALILCVHFLGFYPAAFLFAFGCRLFLRGSAAKRDLLTSLLYAVLLTAAMYLCFTVAVRMSLPAGALFA